MSTNDNDVQGTQGSDDHLGVRSLTPRARAGHYLRLLVDDAIALPVPPDIEEYGVADPLREDVLFRQRDLVEISMVVWDQYAQMLGSNGQGYLSLKQLRVSLFEREGELISRGTQRLNRHEWAQDALDILREESERYGGERRIGDAESLTEPRRDWHWEARGQVLILSIHGSRVEGQVPVSMRSFPGNSTWSSSERRVSQYLLDDDAVARENAEAELLFYRQEVLDQVIYRYETFGYAPLFFGDGGSDTDRTRFRERTLEHSEGALRQQHWAFIKTAREVLLCQKAVTSMTAVFDAVDEILNDDPEIDWARGRARTYAGPKHLRVRAERGRKRGETLGTETERSYKKLKEDVLRLYDEWVEEGFQPVELSCR